MMLVDELGLEDEEEVYKHADEIKDKSDHLFDAMVSWETMSDNDKSEKGITAIEQLSGSTFVILITPNSMRYIPISRVYEIQPKE